MLSSVLRSERAALVNIEIVRVFVRLRELLQTHSDLAQKLGELEATVDRHDEEIRGVFDAIHRLLGEPEEKGQIGFSSNA